MSEEAVAPAPVEAPSVVSTPPESTTMEVEQTHPQPEQHTGAWYQTLPEESARMLNDKDKQYKSFEEYVKATHELRGKLSEKGIIPPSENATESEMAEFLEKVQPYLPSTVPEKYELDALKELDIPDEQAEGIFSEFKNIGLSNDQANQILEFYGKEMAKDIESVQADRQAKIAEAEKALKQEFGSEYDQRLERASTILDKLGEGFGQFATEQGLFTQPEFIKMLDKIGSAESVLPAGTTMSKADINTRIEEIKSDPKFLKGSYEERNALATEMRELISRKM